MFEIRSFRFRSLTLESLISVRSIRERVFQWERENRERSFSLPGSEKKMIEKNEKLKRKRKRKTQMRLKKYTLNCWDYYSRAIWSVKYTLLLHAHLSLELTGRDEARGLWSAWGWVWVTYFLGKVHFGGNLRELKALLFFFFLQGKKSLVVNLSFFFFFLVTISNKCYVDFVIKALLLAYHNPKIIYVIRDDMSISLEFWRKI